MLQQPQVRRRRVPQKQQVQRQQVPQQQQEPQQALLLFYRKQPTQQQL